MRTYPSSSYEGFALAQTIKESFGYTRVTLIYSSDLYGTDGATEFIADAAAMGIDIEFTQSFSPTATDFRVLQESAELDVRVYVLFIRDIGQAGKLMLYMSQTGLINKETVTFGSGSMATSELWSSVTKDPVVAYDMMRGFFVISNADDDWKVTEEGKIFILRYRGLPNTNGQVNATTGERTICDVTTDDDGGFNLYQDSLNGLPPFNCIGLNFSSLQTDGYVLRTFIYICIRIHTNVNTYVL